MPPQSARGPGPQTERRAILTSVWGNLFMAALAFAFALTSHSQAVLLDGAYSLIGVALAALSLRVSVLVMLPDDDRYPFGYVVYEPLLNFAKGLLLAVVTLFALATAIKAVLAGGRAVDSGLALIYALIAAAGCFAFAHLLRRWLRTLASPLVETDRQNWIVDGIISLGVAVGFLGGVLLEARGYTGAARYADPAITILLCIGVLPTPARILWANWRQIVAQAPSAAVIDRVNGLIDAALADAGTGMAIRSREVRVLETGRLLYIHLYFRVGDGNVTVAACDRLRDALWSAINTAFANPALDVSFTTEERWFRHASGDPVTDA